MHPEAVTKTMDLDWSEALPLCVDAIRPLRGIRVPAAVQAGSAWTAHGFWDANGANWLSLSKYLGRVPTRRAERLRIRQRDLHAARGAGASATRERLQIRQR